ncbi:MAG: iron-containing alcohol dehydrogenase [Oscillospiraceae bacterium]|nr:iron-containing alcohol dehydrogenase [Oscillospiraceae bacterium]
MTEFSCKTKIISGAGSVSQLKSLKSQRLLLVTDPYFSQNGTAQQLLTQSAAAHTQIFDKVAPDPSVELVAEGTAAVREFQPDTIAALGGGSAMDCAKAMKHFAGGDCILVMIPTTSGSGSEVTDFAVLTHGNTKHPLVDERLRPDMAILDSDLLKSLPKTLIADAGFDILGHALESFTATGAGTFSDALAKDAFCTVLALLPGSFAGDTTHRGRIHEAATMAGIAFTHAGLGLCHALAHALGAMYHIPHGRLIAILLPAVIDCNAHACGKKYAALARAAGLPGSADSVAVRSLKNALMRLRRELRLPQNLKEAGVDPRQLWHSTPEIIKTALADPCCATNPLKIEDFMVRRVLEEVSGRG